MNTQKDKIIWAYIKGKIPISEARKLLDKNLGRQLVKKYN